MIFVTVGSHPTYKFQRLVDAVSGLPSGDLVVQYGPARGPRDAKEARAWMSFPEMIDYMERASVIVTHAGVGTILAASRIGHFPIVVPRRKQYGETVDDHQVDLAKVLERVGRVFVAWQPEDIGDLVQNIPPRRQELAVAQHALPDAVRAALIGR